MAYENYWLPGFNFNVEEWFEGDQYETLPICRSLALARAAFAAMLARIEAGLPPTPGPQDPKTIVKRAVISRAVPLPIDTHSQTTSIFLKAAIEDLFAGTDGEC